jgi:hypothetical protein
MWRRPFVRNRFGGSWNGVFQYYAAVEAAKLVLNNGSVSALGILARRCMEGTIVHRGRWLKLNRNVTVGDVRNF